MLSIGRLRLSLPPGYEARAERIARLLADELAGVRLEADARVDRLALPPVKVGGGASDREVAAAVAAALAPRLNGGGGGGGRP